MNLIKSLLFILVVFCGLTSLCLAEDPDFGNDHTLAFAVPTGGEYTFGYLESGDADWLKFDIPAFCHFRITLGNQNPNYKQMLVYYKDEFGDPIQFRQWWTNDNTISQTLFVEKATTIYMQVNYDVGGYYVAAEILDTTTNDNYSNDCASPELLVVGNPAVEGVLDHTDPFDVDWFKFHTQPLHKYQINMSIATNSGCYFETYDSSCNRVFGGMRSLTVTSWDGEDYKLYVYGNASSVGEYYTLEVVDLGLYPDDVPNYPEFAEVISTDGNEVPAELEYYSDYHRDEDWFTFTPTGNMKVSIAINNEIPHYKWIGVYQEDEIGQINEIGSWWSNDEVKSKTYFIESARPCYIMVHGDTNVVGPYGVIVEKLEIRPPDSYSNSCSTPTNLAVGSEVTGTLNQVVPYDVDWFEFHTQPLHKYHVQLDNLDNTSVYFSLYSNDCGQLHGNSNSIDVVSWFGEDFKLYVNGNSSLFGNYYTLTVTDIGTYTDDYPNTAATAASIVKNGTMVNGHIDYYGTVQRDEDWFTFIAGIEDTYQFVLDNPENNYKRLDIYKEDSVGNLVHVGGNWTNNSIATLDYSMPAGKSYVKVYGDTNITGSYRVSVLSPEPRCGDLDHPYPLGDVNQDCYVNILDVADMARGWMDCTSPEPPCNYLP